MSRIINSNEKRAVAYGGIAVVVVFLAVVWLVFRTLRFVREVVGAGLALILMAGAVLFVMVDMGMI